jgi:hypothetical protein
MTLRMANMHSGGACADALPEIATGNGASLTALRAMASLERELGRAQANGGGVRVKTCLECLGLPPPGSGRLRWTPAQV